MADECGDFGCGADTPTSTSTTTTTEGNSWQYTINTTYRYHVGPFGNPHAPYYDDDSWNGVAVVYNKNRDANFWVKLSITWNESKGITISSMNMSNYSDYAVLLRGVEITSCSKTTYGYSNYNNGNEMCSGYGTQTPISLPGYFLKSVWRTK
jgi:hypothetical protein